MILIVISLLVLAFYRWTIGLAMFLFFAISFITLETVSAPPANRPDVFVPWARRQARRRPVLLCLGDSLTHGNCSSSFTPEIPTKLCQQLGMEIPKSYPTFADPLWVVNAGQNSITSYTILHERLHKALECFPDYVFILIGTNDMRAVYKPSWSKSVVTINGLPEAPTIQNYERNLTQILNYIRRSSPMTKIGLCQLPPMGEDLTSEANVLIRQANEVIDRVARADGEHLTTVIPLYSRLEALLDKKRGKRSLPIDSCFFLAALMNPLFHLLGVVFSWNLMSYMVGNVVMLDGLHLNDRGRDELVDAIVEWLVQTNVAKSIAVKQ